MKFHAFFFLFSCFSILYQCFQEVGDSSISKAKSTLVSRRDFQSDALTKLIKCQFHSCIKGEYWMAVLYPKSGIWGHEGAFLRPSSQKIPIKRVRYLWNTHSVIFDYLMGANYWSSVNKEKILDPVKYSVSTFRFLSATGSRNNQSPISDGIMMFVHLLTYPSLLLFERYVVWFW